MDSPNKITNRKTGTQVVTGIFSGKPSACPSQPHCVTAVSTPYAAHTDSRFITAALTAIATERNTTSSSTMDSATTTPMSQGSRATMRLVKLTFAAFGPVTYAVSPDRGSPDRGSPYRGSPYRGSTVSCSRFTSALVAASCSPVVG